MSGHQRPPIQESNFNSGYRLPQAPSMSASINVPPVRYEVHVQAKAFLYEITAPGKSSARAGGLQIYDQPHVA